MNRIDFIGGEKGGVGKSVVARLLAQYYIDREIPFTVFDADLSHGAMLRYYADFSQAVDIARFEHADLIIEQSLEQGRAAIVDLAAQAARPLREWVQQSGLLELAEEVELRLVFWHVMDDGLDSMNLLQELFDEYGDRASYVVACNYGRGKDFRHLLSDEVKAWMERGQVPVVEIPGLHAPTMRKIDHVSASFWAASHNTDTAIGPTLGLLERQRVKTWLKRVYGEFDRLLAV